MAAGNRRRGYNLERNTGMKVAVTAIAVAGFFFSWLSFAKGSHPGSATASTVVPSESSRPEHSFYGGGEGTSGGFASPTQPSTTSPQPSSSVPQYRISRGS